jgi:hypothetical protein
MDTARSVSLIVSRKREEETEMGAMAHSTVGLGTQTWNFVRHFLEMCIAMCAGGTVLHLAFFALGGTAGYSDLPQTAPVFSLSVIAITYTLPMAAWMLFRGMDRRPTLEMSLAMLVPAILLIGLAWVGTIATGDLSAWASARYCGPACVAMVVAMLPRLDLYTGRTGHHMGHSAQAA